MSVVLFIPSWYPNRTAKMSGNFIQRIIEADSVFDNVAVLFATPDATLKEKYEIALSNERGFWEAVVYFRQVKGNSLLTLPIKALRRMKAYKIGLKEIQRKLNAPPQLIHVQAALPALLYARRISKKLRVPYLVTEHGISYHTSKKTTLSDKVLFMLMKSAYGHASKIITVSKYLGCAIRKNGIKNDFIVIPNVVPLPNMPMPVNGNAAPKKRILHISTLTEVKNARGIINAIKKVHEQRQDFELVIVSTAEEQKDLIRYVHAKGLSGEVVKFMKYIFDTKELLDLLYSSNFMLLFSYYETFSIVLAESLWAGRPVISSWCGGPEEFISEEFGMFVNPGDEKGLEQAIIKMLDTSQNYDARKMREFARSNFAPAMVGKRMHRVHEEIITEIKR